MAEEQSRIRQIAWLELFPWLGLVRAARLAFAPRMLILAALGLWAMNAGWWAIGLVFAGSKDQVVEDIRAAVHRSPVSAIASPDMNPALVGSELIKLPPVSIKVLDPTDDAALDVQAPWKILSFPFVELFGAKVTFASFVYLLLCGIWALLVWALFGGAITRSAALWYAREDRLGLRRSLLWSVANWRWISYASAPALPLAGVVMAVLPVAILCLLLKADIGVALVGLIWIFMLLCGLFLAILLVGLLFGWPLMWPTISAEGTDCFDALSRSYSYTYQRPVHYLFYAVVAGVLGMLAWIVVLIFAKGVITYSYWAASWGSGGERMNEISQLVHASILGKPLPETLVGGAMRFGVHAIAFWISVVLTVAVGFLFSYFWCAATYIYFLLRQSVDATEMDEVAVEEDTESYGLPPLTSQPGAVPQVTEPPPG